MSDKSLRFFDKIVMAILGFFPFFSGCDEPREMYGTPTADYHILGTVTDSLTILPLKTSGLVLKASWNLTRQATPYLRTPPENTAFHLNHFRWNRYPLA